MADTGAERQRKYRQRRKVQEEALLSQLDGAEYEVLSKSDIVVIRNRDDGSVSVFDLEGNQLG